MDAWSWLSHQWLNLLQGIGIIGSLVFTAMALRQGGTSLRLNALLNLTEQHRELWSTIHTDPELVRVLKPEVDLLASPVSPLEEEFLNLVMVHFQTGWEMVRTGKLISAEAYERDIREFLRLPIPREVWMRTRDHRDPSFVEYVELRLKEQSTLRNPDERGDA
jgi:hypothetical protein